MGLFTKLFGTRSEREVKKLEPQVEAVMALEEPYKKLTDQQLREKTQEFKDRLATGETLDDLLPEAFAVCREAASRVLGMRPYRVQVVGGIVLHQGRIAEMKTGEGKTLVAILPAYLNALTGNGVHIVTVNDYLAKRDSEWMGKVYRFLGLSVGLIIHDLTAEQRRAAYAADITYGTNNELGFDYLRDNMAIYKQEMVQRGHAFAIVDEVDSILIDEARTPLIISGKGEESSKLYEMADFFVSRLKKQVFSTTDDKELQDQYDCDYIVDEKDRTVSLTQKGIEKAEQFFNVENLADPENATLSHHINQAMKARGLMKRDIDYVVKDGQVIIVDEFTGRLMYGRRYNEGLHQAIEAKEGVKVASENKTLATITFQNFFRLYGKLSGMTGTAMTEQEEFGTIYNLDIIEIPTNRPVARIDHHDAVYKTMEGKYRAVIAQVKECHEKGQPVLVGTVSIEKNETLSRLLTREGIRHNVLNAKNHEKEAEIVAQAGKLGAVTVATNMAGRGTDIMLGGNAEYLAKADLVKAGYSEEVITDATGYAETDNQEILEARALFAERMAYHKSIISQEAEKVRAAGGLFIIGTERHDSRRIDNQLRGRAGRQGDPGSSQFFLSMQDDLMRLFGSERVSGLIEKMGLAEDEPIEAKMLTGQIENAQKRIEARNYEIRKNVLQYDDVMNEQRKEIYEQRKQVLEGRDMHETIVKMADKLIEEAVATYCGNGDEYADWDMEGLTQYLERLCIRIGFFKAHEEAFKTVDKEELIAKLKQEARDFYALREKGFELIHIDPRELERVVLLSCVDRRWMDHIDAMDQLRDGIGLRAYGNKNPITEYQIEGYDMFDEMVHFIREDTVRRMYQARINIPQQRKEVAEPKETNLEQAKAAGGPSGPKRVQKQVGRNDPCPCGSGKKYKNCCGRDNG